MSNPNRALVGVAVVLAAAMLVTAAPASAAGYTGGLAPTALDGRLDVNGSGGVGGRDDSNGFYGQTDVIDGSIDCDGWGSTPNAGTAGDHVIDDADDCTLIGVDGSVEGATIVVEDGSVVSVDGAPVPSAYAMPAIFNASDPDDGDIADADFGWWAFDGRVDANANGTIDDVDCARGVVGETDDVGFGAPTDGADVLGSSSLCPNATAQSPAVNGLVDLNSDEQITDADTCGDGCFLGQDIAAGFVGGVAGPAIGSFTPTSGPSGTTVTITGTMLAGATEVRFNGVLATIVSNDEGQIVVTVPSGATTGSITVATRSGQATSSSAFTVTTTPPPGGAHPREVTLTLRGHLAARGVVTALDGTTECAAGIDVRLQRRIGKRWRTIQAAQTRRNMTYIAILPSFPGKYRAFLPNATLRNGERCASATSVVVRR